jgi:hypothetical protein
LARIASAFPIDRRELADQADRSAGARAIRALEAVAFLVHAISGKGSQHKLTGAGELHRKPVMFQFGSEYAASFSQANQRAQGGRGRHLQARRA